MITNSRITPQKSSLEEIQITYTSTQTSSKDTVYQKNTNQQLLQITTNLRKDSQQNSTSLKEIKIAIPNQPIAQRLERDPKFLERVKKITYRNMWFPYINYPSTLRKKRLETAAAIMVAEQLVETEKAFEEYPTPSRVTHFRFINEFKRKEIHTALYVKSQKVLEESSSIFENTNIMPEHAFKKLQANTQIIRSLIKEENLPRNLIPSPKNT